MSHPTRIADAVSSPSKTDFDHETLSTLPNPNGKSAPNGSVMCPKTSEEALRSKPGAPATSAANDVTHKEDAQHPAQGGAAFAGAVATRRTQSAAANVIEAGFEGDENSSWARAVADNCPEVSDDDVIEVLKRARGMLVEDKASRARRRDTAPSQSTRDTYQRKCNLIDASVAAFQDPWAPLLQLVMAHYAPRRQSFFVMRAALKWRALGRVRSQIRTLALMQRTGRRDADWYLGVRDLSRMNTELQQILDLDRSSCLELSDRAAVRSKSKKSTLRRLKPGWRDIFLIANEHSETYKRAGVLMRFCGFRPRELELGVEAELIGDQVRVQIAGAKVRETAGQPWRQFSLHAAKLPAWFVAELKSGKKTYTADADNMRQHLVRISAKLYPRKYKDGTPDIILSAYVFRHALVTDLRAEGWSVEDIAAVLGESAAETASWYGFRPQRGSRNAEPSAVVQGSTETCRPIRPPDRTWLAKHVSTDRFKPTKARSPGRKM